MVPGHEIVGKVIKVGRHVKKFKVGDRAGVGVMIDSCRTMQTLVTILWNNIVQKE
jgi:uncharacterized zinc-type alcohol dehydrogenase-like protein